MKADWKIALIEGEYYACELVDGRVMGWNKKALHEKIYRLRQELEHPENDFIYYVADEKKEQIENLERALDLLVVL